MPLDVRSTSDLGRLGFAEGLEVQRTFWGARLRGEIGDTLLLCEHPPVYTLGTHADPALVLDSSRADVIRTDRGGEVTWHGPGQVVGYAICSLEERGRDLHRFCRDLEEIVSRTLADFGLAGRRVAGLTGVWIGEEKVAAIGVRARRWVTTHGFALNVDCDLDYYRGIVPCGIPDRGVTSMARALGRPVEARHVRERCAAHFEDLFGG